MKKTKKNSKSSHWQIALTVVLFVIAFSGLTMATASARRLTVEQMIVEYFLPCFIGCSILALALGFILVLVERVWRKAANGR